jgi:DNA-binding NarL/FixJ family response regulator
MPTQDIRRKLIMEDTFHIILAEDHVRFREEIKKIIEEIPGVEVVAEVGEGNELFDLLADSQPDLILLDISMPNLRAMKATQQIKSRYPKIKIIIMVMDEESEYLTHAMAAGADGLLLKQDCARELNTAIQQIRRGETYFPLRLEEKKFDGDLVRPNRLSRLTFPSIC